MPHSVRIYTETSYMNKSEEVDRLDIEAADFMASISKFLYEYRQCDAEERLAVLLALRVRVDEFRKHLFKIVPNNGQVFHIDFKNRRNTGKA